VLLLAVFSVCAYRPAVKETMQPTGSAWITDQEMDSRCTYTYRPGTLLLTKRPNPMSTAWMQYEIEETIEGFNIQMQQKPHLQRGLTTDGEYRWAGFVHGRGTGCKIILWDVKIRVNCIWLQSVRWLSTR